MCEHTEIRFLSLKSERNRKNASDYYFLTLFNILTTDILMHSRTKVQVDLSAHH